MHSPPPVHAATADPRESPWYPYDNGSGHFDANLAMILIFLFCALICALALNAAIRFFLRRSSSSSSRRPRPSQDAEPEKPANAASAPTLVYSAGMKLAGAAAECAICLCEFVDGEGVRVLPRCKHGFHVKCIEGWLNSAHFSCPTCRSSCLLTSSPEKSPIAVTTVTATTEEVVLHIEDSAPTSESSSTSTTEQVQRRSHEAE